MIKTILLLAFPALAMSQTGSIVSTPPALPQPAKPAQVQAVTASGAYSCTLMGDAAPATAVLLTCSSLTTTIGPYPFPLGPGDVLELTRQNAASEVITFVAVADATGAIRVSAAVGIVGQPKEVAQNGLKF